MFRRKKGDDDVETAAEDAVEPEGPRARGPWDVSEVTLDEDDTSRVDLGSLLITPHDGLTELVLGKTGREVAFLVATGRAELGITFTSEFVPVEGTRVVGPLPGTSGKP